MDVVSADDLGHVIALPTQELLRPGGGVFIPPLAANTHDPDSLFKYLAIVRQSSKPAIKAYGASANQMAQFLSDELSVHEGWPVLMKHRFFSELTQPLNYLSDQSSTIHAAYQKLDAPTASDITTMQRSRILSYEEHLANKNSDFRQICSKESIENWALTGFRDDYPHRDAHIRNERHEIVARIDRVIELLRRYERFQIALRSGPDVNDTDTWLVRGEHKVLIGKALPEGRRRRGIDSRMNLALRHRDVARIVSDEFTATWNRLPAHERDKRAVIDYLTQLKHRIE
jgi:hypothetical protein